MCRLSGGGACGTAGRAAKPWEVDDEMRAVIESLLPEVERRNRYPGRKTGAVLDAPAGDQRLYEIPDQAADSVVRSQVRNRGPAAGGGSTTR